MGDGAGHRIIRVVECWLLRIGIDLRLEAFSQRGNRVIEVYLEAVVQQDQQYLVLIDERAVGRGVLSVLDHVDALNNRIDGGPGQPVVQWLTVGLAGVEIGDEHDHPVVADLALCAHIVFEAVEPGMPGPDLHSEVDHVVRFRFDRQVGKEDVR